MNRARRSLAAGDAVIWDASTHRLRSWGLNRDDFIIGRVAASAQLS